MIKRILLALTIMVSPFLSGNIQAQEGPLTLKSNTNG